MTAQTWVVPVTLTGERIRMEPLGDHHLDDLARVAFDTAVWRWTLGRSMDDAGLRGADATRYRPARVPATLDGQMSRKAHQVQASWSGAAP